MVKGLFNMGNPFTGKTSSAIFTQVKKRGGSDYLAKLFVAWSKFETGNYTSGICKRGNNYFGYTLDKNSKYQNGQVAGSNQTAGRFGSYDTLQGSVNENYDWLQRRYKRQDRGVFPDPNSINDIEQFVKLLKQANYFGEPLAVYTAGVKSHFGNLT